MIRVLVAALAIAGCRGGQDHARARADAAARPATPVGIAAVTRADLDVAVTAPGRTQTIEQQQVRAPFAGTLVKLSVEDGDRVRTGQVIGGLLSRESQAELVGAEEMVRAARTPAARRNAARALTLARRARVERPLRVPESGVVVAHHADEGSLVAQDEDIVDVAAADSIVFVADVPQDDLPRIRRDERATVQLASRPTAFAAVVHAVLPTSSAKDLTSPVRLDFTAGSPLAVGLFGTARIVVDRRLGVVAVPAAAVLRDDVTGKTRVARVEGGVARWVPVETGVAARGLVEIVSPPLPVGAPLIVRGQVGLPDGAPVAVSP